MFIEMCWAITASRWAGFRGVYGSRFPRFCSSLSSLTNKSSRSRNRLLGPPEIHKPNICPSDITRIPFQYPPPSSCQLRSLNLDARDPHPCIELFIQISRDLPDSYHFWHSRLENSWSHDSLTTLKIIAYVKRQSRTMKHGLEQFYTAALWLHIHHPRSLADNLKGFYEFGSLKDWLEILYRLVKGPSVRFVEFEKIRRGRQFRVVKLSAKRSGGKYWGPTKENDQFFTREERRIRMAREAVEMYDSDPNYRYLHDKVSDLFAELLKSDLEFLDSGDYEKISLASKWCPSIGSSYDRSTLICESIARKLFPYESNPEYKGLEEAHYVYRVRDCLQKRVLVPLRRALKLPEIYMTSNQWNSLPYDRVSFTARRTYKRQFVKHDQERFLQHIQDREEAKKRELLTSGRELLPHEIFKLLNWGYDGKFVDAQWNRMVDAFSEKGKFKNCIVVFDPSSLESFVSKPKLALHFCLSFQLLASDLSDSPWKGNILRKKYSEEQSDDKTDFLMKVEGDNLQSKMEFLKSLEYDSTRMWRLLDKILETAVFHKIGKEKMVRRLFVFGTYKPEWEITSPYPPSRHSVSTKIEANRKKFEDCGYAMPDLVFWDLCSGNLFWEASQVKFYYNDIMSIKFLSRRSIEVFWEKDGKLETNTMLDSQISGEEYMALKVLD